MGVLSSLTGRNVQHLLAPVYVCGGYVFLTFVIQNVGVLSSLATRNVQHRFAPVYVWVAVCFLPS